MTQKTTKYSDQKEAIKEAALSLFTEKGYAGTSMTQIAERAGVNPATIYRFYPGKRELFETLERPDLDFPDQQELQSRRDIVKCAMSVFSQKGYAAATMDEIAEAVGVSKPAIYFYFPSKEKLFAAVLENPAGFTMLDSSMQAFLSNEGSNLEEGLFNLAKTYLSLFQHEESSNLLKIVLSEGLHSSDIARGFTENIIKRGSINVASYLSKFCTLEPKKLMFRIQTLFGMLFSWGLVNLLLVSDPEDKGVDTEDLDSIAREYVRQFLYGISDSIKSRAEMEKN